jgi:hypothetical protein
MKKAASDQASGLSGSLQDWLAETSHPVPVEEAFVIGAVFLFLPVDPLLHPRFHFLFGEPVGSLPDKGHCFIMRTPQKIKESSVALPDEVQLSTVARVVGRLKRLNAIVLQFKDYSHGSCSFFIR